MKTHYSHPHTIILPPGFKHNEYEHDLALGCIVNGFCASNRNEFLSIVQNNIDHDFQDKKAIAYWVSQLFLVNRQFYSIYPS
jgi:hypothetical protein